MRTASLVVIAVLLIVTPVAALGGGGPPPTQDTPEADNTVTRIDLEANGSAVWEVQFRTRLETDAEVDEYNAFQSTFRNDTAAFLDPYSERIQSVVTNAENETDRPMSATNFEASTSIQQVPRRFGVVTFRFRWQQFAETTDDRIRVGDVFVGGFFVGSNDTLIVTAPDGFQLDTVEPAPDDRTTRRVQWTGQVSFGDERPSLVAVPQPTATPTATRTPTPTATQTPAATRSLATDRTTATTVAGDSGGLPVVPLVAVVLVAVILVALASQTDTFDGLRGSDAGPDDTDAGGAGATRGSNPNSVNADTDSVNATNTDASTNKRSDSGETTATDSTGTPADATTADDVYENVLADIRPPLTDEDRVRKTLAENNGRMRQSDIADTLEWSDSKTSRVLSDMADDEQVEKLRVGRQNVIDLLVNRDDDRV